VQLLDLLERLVDDMLKSAERPTTEQVDRLQTLYTAAVVHGYNDIPNDPWYTILVNWLTDNNWQMTIDLCSNWLLLLHLFAVRNDTVTVTVTICGDARPLSRASAEAYKLCVCAAAIVGRYVHATRERQPNRLFSEPPTSGKTTAYLFGNRQTDTHIRA